MENINSLRHVGTAKLLPDTPAACGHSSRTIQVSGCRDGGVGMGEGRMDNGNHRNQWWEDQGASRLTRHLAGWKCVGDSNNSNSSIMGKK